MGLDYAYIHGQTPLDEDEKDGLLIKTITTRGELDEFEQLNNENAVQWTLGKRFRPETLLSEQFVKELHYRMFCDVWSWAGEFRKTDKNIGVDKNMIGVSLKQLTEDFQYWIGNKIYDNDEAVIRFSHQIVLIHCFPNGNGRHSRLIADVFRHSFFNLPPYTWSKESLIKKGESRKKYIDAIKMADNGNINPLINFAKS